MTNSEQTIREFAEKWAERPKGIKRVTEVRTEYIIKDLTALIAEHYYPKEQYEELLKRNEALITSLKEIAECKGAYSMDRLEHATNVIKESKAIAEKAIKTNER